MAHIAAKSFGGWLRVGAATLIVLALGAAGGYWMAPKSTASPAETGSEAAVGGETAWYTCGMHPQVLQRGPGNCPICGMKLTPKKSDAEAGAPPEAVPQERKTLYWRDPHDPSHVSDRPGTGPEGMELVPVYAGAGEVIGGPVLRIEPVTIQNMGIRTARVRRGALVKTIRTVGRVDYDEQSVVFVDTKITGWIEKLHVDQTGQVVKAGDPLFDVYSPDLWQAQIEYISAVRKLPTLEKSTFADAAEDARRMVDAARMKLEYFDVSNDQIGRIQNSLTPEKTLEIRSPAAGIVSEKAALEGMRVMPGTRLYTIADLSRVWVYVDIYEYQLPWVHVGQPATMILPYIPAKAFRGKVYYIYPYLQKQTRVIKVRLEFENPTMELKPEMYANVTLEGLLNENALLVPREGYLDSGVRKVAFVDRGGGKFEPRDIHVGVEGEGGWVEVVFGLDEGDVVVTSGQFLLDSESKLKEAVAKMMEPMRSSAALRSDRATHAGLDVGAATSRPGAIPADAAYACPMDRHPDEEKQENQGAYYSKDRGECPRCGMALVSIDELPWARAIMAAGGAEVAYTCPVHQHVFSASTATCPRCGKNLEPFKAMYTCPNPKHARQTRAHWGECPQCGLSMVAYRGPWLGEAQARLNQPPGGQAEPPVHAGDVPRVVPSGARFVCPMQECWQFATQEGECPSCGMDLRPIGEIAWASRLVERATAPGRFVCPMHPTRAASDDPGFCRICAMRLVRREDLIGLDAGPFSVQAQVDFLMEHYFGIHEQLAGDRVDQLASHALGLVDASETLHKLLGEEQESSVQELRVVATALHDAAIKIKSRDLAQARAQFSELTQAMRAAVIHRRPDRRRWPTLYIYHCPMAQADWIQSVEKKANPYYGFKMLDCGKLVETK